MKGNYYKDLQLNYSLTNKSSSEKIMIFTDAAFIDQMASDNIINFRDGRFTNQIISRAFTLRTHVVPWFKCFWLYTVAQPNWKARDPI